jgi:hypothetical protein
MLAQRLRECIDAVFPPVKGVFIGGRPHTQTLDIADGLRTVVEKALDDKSKAALADFDVANFYDEHSLIKLLAWMLKNGVPVDIAVPVIRLHAFPAIRLKGGSEQFRIKNRSKGSLTGSRSANELARIPIQQSIADSLPAVQHLGYPCGDISLVALTYIDNIFTVGSCSSDAITTSDTIARHLERNWEHRIKAGSRHIMPIDRSDTFNSDGWEIVSVLECLGHFIAADGSIRSPLSRTRHLAWKAFYSKFRRQHTKHLDDEMLASEVTLHIEPVVMYRASGWPFQKKGAAEVDALQAKLVSAAVAIPRLIDEPDAEYHRRRCRVTNHLCEQVGRWSIKWAARVTAWGDHIKRNTGGQLWSGLLSSTRDARWLQVRRSGFAPQASVRPNAWTAFAGRTDSRLSRGSPPTRFDQGLVDAFELLEAIRKARLIAPFKAATKSGRKLDRNFGTNAIITKVLARTATTSNNIEGFDEHELMNNDS